MPAFPKARSRRWAIAASAIALLGAAGAGAAPRAKPVPKPVATSVPAFTLPDTGLIPEGIAWDPVRQTLYVGSLAKRKIVSIGPDGAVSDLVPAGRDGLEMVLGMKVDPSSRSLWVCSAEADDADGNPNRRSALYRFELPTGRLLDRYASPAGGKHLFNDAAVTRGGEVYLTDSEAGRVYRLPPGADSLEIVASVGRLSYPNGIALSGDERFLYVAHETGIVVWERASGRAFPLGAAKAVHLGGIDGLAFHRGALVAIQNGEEPHRVTLFTLSPAGDRAVDERVLERGNPLFEIPTTGAVAGDDFYYIANAQLSALGPGGAVKDPGKRRPIVILKLALPR